MALDDLMPWNWDKKAGSFGCETDEKLCALHKEFNRIFDQLKKGLEDTPFASSKAFKPRISVVEKEEEIRISAELPGMGEDDVEVILAETAVTLKGVKPEEPRDESDGAYYTERQHGAFQRDVPLPCEIDESKVEAVFANGLLTVHLPKTVDAKKKVKRVQVKKG